MKLIFLFPFFAISYRPSVIFILAYKRNILSQRGGSVASKCKSTHFWKVENLRWIKIVSPGLSFLPPAMKRGRGLKGKTKKSRFRHPRAVFSFHYYDLIKQLKIIMLSFVLSSLAEIIVYRFNFWLFHPCRILLLSFPFASPQNFLHGRQKW